MRGYYGIGIIGSKTPENIGTLWRSAANLQARFLFTVGARYPQQACDTVKAWRHVPMFEYDGRTPIENVKPRDCELVVVEQHRDARPLPEFVHPERAVYLLGAEDNGVPDALLGVAQHVVEVPSTFCLNVAVAGSIVMYDRVAKERSV